MKCVIFCRVSSKEQEETGYSLPAQEKFLRDYADKNQLDVVKVFAVSESASGRIQRKTFNEMISYISKHNISVIIVETTDRLTRNFADVPTIDKWVLEDSSNQIHLAKESCILHKDSKSHEWFMWRVKVATAEYYVRLLSENVKKGQKEKIAQGWLPTKPPIGYKTVGEKGHKIHVVDNDKAAIVKKMFELCASNEYSIKRITKIIEKEGLRNEGGHKITKSRVHEYLHDPFYIGIIRWNDVEYQGKQKPIIDEGLFMKVQQILRGKTVPMMRKHNFLFKGLIYCYGCGGLITWETKKGHIYGHCNHYRDCKQHRHDWPQENEVEEQLLKHFKGLEIKSPRLIEWLRKALKESHKDEIAYHSASLENINKQHELFKQRLDRLYDDKLDNKITEAFYQQKFKEYSEGMKEADKSLTKHANVGNTVSRAGNGALRLVTACHGGVFKGNTGSKAVIYQVSL